MLYRDCICLWLVYYGYNKALTRETVQLYYISLAKFNKTRLYKEFYRPNLKIYIIISFNALTHSADILDINYYYSLLNVRFGSLLGPRGLLLIYI